MWIKHTRTMLFYFENKNTVAHPHLYSGPNQQKFYEQIRGPGIFEVVNVPTMSP